VCYADVGDLAWVRTDTTKDPITSRGVNFSLRPRKQEYRCDTACDFSVFFLSIVYVSTA